MHNSIPFHSFGVDTHSSRISHIIRTLRGSVHGLILIGTFLGFGSAKLFAQDQVPENWFNLDFQSDGIMGVSSEKTYATLLKGKKARTVVVAIIDSGVDADHEDLSEVMWINEDEIPGNKRDDDGNGYIDDLHGWNFIGNEDGRNVHHDSYEITRLYALAQDKWDGVDPNTLSGKKRKEYEAYEALKAEFEAEKQKALGEAGMVNSIWSGVKAIREATGTQYPTLEEINAVEAGEGPSAMGMFMIKTLISSGEMSFKDLADELESASSHFEKAEMYGYNPDFDPRTDVVGDNYEDSSERIYGNNDVEGPDAFHGTHVAGIVGADRDNGIGMKGVANHVRIMAIRAVPDGDERDKDVANAIRYAVDNGADIINMSFGKGYSWDKDVVDKAVKYAEKHDVLLVHAAGNDAENNDETDNFPNDEFSKSGFLGFGSKASSTWLEVGALSWAPGSKMIAGFSNYGPDQVDVFAPGVDILSTVPGGGYNQASGTSMASPVTAGVAAVIRAYFPTLTARQVKEVIMNSAVPVSENVIQPGGGPEVSMTELCQTGGVVNLYNAVQLASSVKGKRRLSKEEKAIFSEN